MKFFDLVVEPPSVSYVGNRGDVDWPRIASGLAPRAGEASPSRIRSHRRSSGPINQLTYCLLQGTARSRPRSKYLSRPGHTQRSAAARWARLRAVRSPDA